MHQWCHDHRLQTTMDWHRANWTAPTADLTSIANTISIFTPRLREVVAVIRSVRATDPNDPALASWRAEWNGYLTYLRWARGIFQGWTGGRTEEWDQGAHDLIMEATAAWRNP